MYTIILIDDEKAIVDRMKKAIQFEKMGLSLVATAYNGLEGFNQIAEHLPDIIICDISMPEMSGFSMLESIKQIKNYAPVVILITGHNDFDHAKKAIQFNVLDYLVKPVIPTELYDVLERAIEICKKNHSSMQNHQKYNNSVCSNIIEKLLHHGAISSEETSMLQQSGILLTAQYYMVLKIKLSNYANLCNILDDNNINTIKENILNKFATISHQLYSTSFNIDETYFIIPTNGNPQAAIESRCTEILSELNYENVCIFLMISDSCKDIENLPLLLDHIDYCSKFTFCFNENKVLVYNKIFSYMQNAFQQNLFQKFDAEMNSSVTWNIAQIKNQTSTLSSITKKFEYYDPNYIRNIAYHSLTMIVNNFLDNDSSLKNDITSTLWNNISNTNSIYELIELYNNVILSLNTLIFETTEQRYKRLSEQIKSYIENNYMHQLSTSVMAESLFVSDRTLRRAFQAENGTTINDYLQKYRINKAYEILLTKQYKTYEVATLVGYNDLKSFRKAFIHHFGKSPSQILSEQKN